MKYNNYSGLPFNADPESFQVTPESLENFESSLIRIKHGEKRKRCHPRSDFRL